MYLRARYYDSTIGRFINEDPVFDGLNWYVYCANNPVNMVDPSGLKAGKLYKNANEASKVWAKKTYGVTKYILMEQSSLIYRVKRSGKNKYAYSKAIVGNPHSATPFSGKIPQKGTLVAYIHSHPNSTNFSQADKNFATNNNINAYVVVPGSRSTRVDVKSYKYNSSINAYETKTVATDIVFNQLTKSKKKSLKKKYQSAWNSHLSTGCNFNCNSKTWPNT